MISIGLGLGLALGVGTGGCGKKRVELVAIPVEQVPAAIEKAFREAPAETRETATVVVTAVQTQDEPSAFVELHALSERPNLTQEQRAAAVQAMLTLHQRLVAAAAQGDQKAEAALEHYRATK